MLLMSTRTSGEAKRSFSMRDQALPPGQHLGFAATVVQQADRLVERARGFVAEAGWVDASLLSVLLPLSPRVSGPSRDGDGRRTPAGRGRRRGATRPRDRAARSWWGGHGPCTGWPATFR